MKTIVNRIGLMVAAALALGGMAYGQEMMRADVPFSFRASHTVLPAGRYTVIQEGASGQVVRLWNQATRLTVMNTTGPLDTYHHQGNPQLTFVCVTGVCSLSKIRTSTGTLSYPLPKDVAHRTQTATISTPLLAYNGK